jgi:hypothetical protein
LLQRQLQWEEDTDAEPGASSPEITKLLIAAGADVNLVSVSSNGPYQTRENPPLTHAIPTRCGRGWWRPEKTDAWQNMRLLLDAGANPNTVTVTGATPLLVACDLECIESVRILLQRDAHANIADDEGHTPLTSAAFNTYIELIELLFHYGADPNQPCSHLTTTAGSMCAGDGPCVALFKAERVRLAKLEYNEIKNKLKVFSYGKLPRVSQKTHMDGIDDVMGNIALQMGFISMKDRLLAIDKLADQELHEYKTIIVPLREAEDAGYGTDASHFSHSDTESE